jgi:hypothetical protein
MALHRSWTYDADLVPTIRHRTRKGMRAAKTSENSVEWPALLASRVHELCTLGG